MSNHVRPHEDPTLKVTWMLAADGSATVMACWRADGERSETFVVDDLEAMPESLADIIREHGRVKGEYPHGWRVTSGP
jgi:hypothetical protein